MTLLGRIRSLNFGPLFSGVLVLTTLATALPFWAPQSRRTVQRPWTDIVKLEKRYYLSVRHWDAGNIVANSPFISIAP